MFARRFGHLIVLTAALCMTGCPAAQHGSSASSPTTPLAAKHASAKGSSTSTSIESDDCASPSTNDDDADTEQGATVDDGFDAPVTSPGGATTPLPFADLSDADIAARLKADIGALGPMSIGHAHGGVLVAGAQMPAGANWELMSPTLSWGTKETVDALAHAIDAVAARFPSTPKAFIGNISAKNGGHLPPHVSHQSGRDVDLSYYLRGDGHRWYAMANASNLDRPRTWHLVRTLIADSDVDLILVDVRIQRLLKAYALDIGEDPAWLDQIFQVGGKSQRPILFHANGHATHLHVRFYSPAAQELGRRAYRVLLSRRLITPPTVYVTHTTKPGDTLSHLALRYKVSADTIKKANGLTNDLLRVNKLYKIPQTGGVPMPGKLDVPARRVPPSTPNALASISDPKRGAEPCRGARSGG